MDAQFVSCLLSFFCYPNVFSSDSLTSSLQAFFWLSFPFQIESTSVLYLLVWKWCSPCKTQLIGRFLNKISNSASSSAFLSCLYYTRILEFITLVERHWPGSEVRLQGWQVAGAMPGPTLNALDRAASRWHRLILGTPYVCWKAEDPETAAWLNSVICVGPRSHVWDDMNPDRNWSSGKRKSNRRILGFSKGTELKEEIVAPQKKITC